MIEADKDIVTSDVQAAVGILRAALGQWTCETMAELVAVEFQSAGAVRSGIDLGTLEDTVLSLDYDLEYLSVKLDAVQLLMRVICGDLG